MEKSRNGMKTLKYKGYVGSIEFSAEDGVLFGEILGINSLVTYQGKTTQELTSSFHEAVDDYLAFCQDNGIKPQKSYSGVFNVRISPETHRAVSDMAAEAGITINSFVKRALNNALMLHDPGILMEPEGPVYGSRTSVTFRIPNADKGFAKELAIKMGWEIE